MSSLLCLLTLVVVFGQADPPADTLQATAAPVPTANAPAEPIPDPAAPSASPSEKRVSRTYDLNHVTVTRALVERLQQLANDKRIGWMSQDNGRQLEIIAPSQEVQDRVQDAIRQFDVPPEIKVFSLKHLAAAPTVKVLDSFLFYADERPRLTADTAAKTVLARGTKDQLATVEAILNAVDVARSDMREIVNLPTDIGKAAMIPLKHANAGEVSGMLGRLFPHTQGAPFASFIWEQSELTSNSILLRAPADQFDRVVELIRTCDVPAKSADAEPKPAPEAAVPETTMKVFSLANADATASADLVRHLFADQALSIAPDARTNTLIARGSEELLQQIAALLIRLDEDNTDRRGGNSPPTGAGRAPTGSLTGTSGDVALPPRPQLQQTYDQAEARAAALAQQLRALPAEHPDRAKLSAELRQAVAAAFEARQQLQRAELAALQQRLASIQQSLTLREHVRQEIIDRRIGNLLNPASQWEPSPPESANPIMGLSSGNNSSVPSTTQTPASKLELSVSATQTVQIRFQEPSGARLAQVGSAERELVLPTRLNLVAGAVHRLLLSQIPGQTNLPVPLSLSVDLYPLTPRTEPFLQRHAIPVKVVEEDLDQVLSGNLVTKVLYLTSTSDGAKQAIETLVSNRLGPSVDPVQEATHHGEPLAIVRIQPITLINPSVSSSSLPVDPGNAKSVEPPKHNAASVWSSGLGTKLDPTRAIIVPADFEPLALRMLAFDVSKQADMRAVGIEPASAKLQTVAAKEDFGTQLRALVADRHAWPLTRATLRSANGEQVIALLKDTDPLAEPTPPGKTPKSPSGDAVITPADRKATESDGKKTRRVQVTVRTRTASDPSAAPATEKKPSPVAAPRTLLVTLTAGAVSLLGPFPTQDDHVVRYLALTLADDVSENTSTDVSFTNDPNGWPFRLPRVADGATGLPVTEFRLATEIRLQFRSLQQKLDRLKTSLKESPNDELAATWRRDYAAAEQHLAALRDEYEAQLKLLRLEGAEARTALTAAQRNFERQQLLREKGVTTADEVQTAALARDQAQYRVERNDVQLDFYTKAGSMGVAVTTTETPSRGADEAAEPSSESLSRVSGPLDNAAAVRTATEMRNRFRAVQEAIQQADGVLQQSPNDVVAKRQRDVSQYQLAALRDEYAAQMKLLQLERNAAESAFNAAEAEWALEVKLHQTGQSAQANVLKLVAPKEAAKLRLERSEVLLELFKKVLAAPEPAPTK